MTALWLMTPGGHSPFDHQKRWSANSVSAPPGGGAREARRSRTRINLILYHGALAPRAGWRRAVVPSSVTAPETFPAPAACEVSTEGADGAHAGRLPNRTWAERMQRSFGFDVLACPRKPGERVVTRAPTTWNSLWQPRAWLPKAMFARQRQGVREDFFLRRAAMFGLRLTVHDDLAPIPEGCALKC